MCSRDSAGGKGGRILSERFAQKWRHRVQKEPETFPFDSSGERQHTGGKALRAQPWLILLPMPHGPAIFGFCSADTRSSGDSSSGSFRGDRNVGFGGSSVGGAQLPPSPARLRSHFRFSFHRVSTEDLVWGKKGFLFQTQLYTKIVSRRKSFRLPPARSV